MFFQFVFCAVSLAIVWGTTLERIKFGVYVIYAVIFSAVIYPVISHWIFGGGWLQVNVGMQDFAGSTVVHLIGATGALAALLLLGPRIGKYGPDGKPRAIPGPLDAARRPRRADPVARLVRVQPGLDARRDRQPVRRDRASSRTSRPRPACWPRSRRSTCIQKTIDIGMAGNGAIAGLVAITAPSGYVEYWAAPIIGAVAGVIVVVGVLAIEKVLDDPVGALSAHGLAGIWGTLSCGIFTSPRYAELNAVGDPRPLVHGQLPPARRPGARHRRGVRVRVRQLARVFGLIKATIGLRVSAEQEEAGLDIVEHGMYGYPEQFIPVPEQPASVHRRMPVRRARDEGRRLRPRARHRRFGEMKKIEAFIRHEAFEPIRMELLEKGFPSLSVGQYRGSGRQKGITEHYRGSELTIHLRPKMKLEIVVDDKDVGIVNEAILKHARTGEIGDGKIFVLPVEDAIRIRTGESGEEVLQSHESGEIPAGV